MELYIFGDQTADCRQFLRKVLLRKGNVLLTSFLESAANALREEISQLTNVQYRRHFPNFSSVQELVERYYEEGKPNPAIESAIVCLSQLAHFIGYFEGRPKSYLASPSTSHPDTRLLGLCTGFLAASAVASVDSLTALVPLAVEVLRVAFRTGVHVADVSERLESRLDGQDSWSTILAGVDAQSAEEILQRFHARNVISPSNRLWISAVAANSITVSGPPSVLKRIFESSDYFPKSHQLKVPVHGPYHAPHLHSAEDIHDIITPAIREVFGQLDVQFPVFSSVTGKQIPVSNSLELLEKSLKEILLERLQWNNVLEHIVPDVLASPDRGCKVHAIGPTNITSSLVSALKTAGAGQVYTEDFNSWLSQPPAISPSMAKMADSNIAIVGMAGRFPDAADHELLWALLEQGLDVHREIPKDRFNVETHVDPTAKVKNTSHTPYGCFVENPGLFDARFFNMSPREAAQTDPMQRLMLTTAYEAMEMAGIVPNRTPSTKADRIGTFYGQTSDDWREINAAQDIDTYFISGGVRAFGAGRINYFFKFSGPSFIVDTACSSSMAAIQLACTSLRAGECDTAFTGGANILTNPDIFSGLSRGHFLSKTGSCKTFDNDADGYCRGDGVATVILKRLDDALADKDPILGVIRASATNHSAEAVSITHPHVGAQQFLFSKVLKESGVDAHDISYVEMHGTGTQAGDGVEMQSVSSVFAPTNRRRRADQPLYLGSIKSNIGHGESVSGVSALIKILLMMQKSTIPPHCGIKGTLNKTFPTDLRERNINIALKKTPFPRPAGGSRLVFLNNFSAAGGNTALLLEDGPEKQDTQNQDPRSTKVVAVSAKSLASFRKNVQRLRSYIDATPNVDLASLAYTCTARRSHHNYRAAFAVTDVKQVSAALDALRDASHSPISMTPPRVAFVFTGQGSQYPALGKQLFETSKQFRSDLEQFNNMAEAQGFVSFLGLVDGNAKDIKTLSPVAVQLGLACIQIALVRLWASWGIKPSVVIGHSLGEYAALNTAGVLSIADTIYLVGERARQLERDCTIGTHAMLAIKGSVSSIKEAVNGTGCEVACVNGPTEMVLSGTVSQIDELAGNVNAHGFKCTKLNVPFAFHSSQVDTILESFREKARAATFHAPEIPVISPLLGKVIRDDRVFGPDYLSQHCRGTVDFLGGLTAANMEGLVDKKTVWVEIGAHPVCSGMVKSTIDSSVLTVPSLRRDEDAWKTIANAVCALYLGGITPNWSAYHQDFESSVTILDLPSYGFDDKVYWLDYTNDWCLTKGDVPATVLATAAAPKFSTTSIHRIAKETFKGNTANVVAESNFSDPLLHAAISGHTMHGAGLCPSSVYADMAYTVAKYAYNTLRPGDEKVHMNIRNMENPAPLFLKDNKKPEDQPLQVEATVDLSLKEAVVVISSLGSDNKPKTIHGKCVVTFEDYSQWVYEWERNAFLVRSRIDVLKKKMEDGDAHRILRGMVYKLFSALVAYGDKYRGMKEVTLDSPNLEATSLIEFQAGPKDGDFFLSPYLIDSMAHLAGFVVNGNDQVDSKSDVYISHGWESMRFAKTVEADKRYHSYVKMQPVGPKTVAGDVYIFDDKEKIVGVVGGLKFHCIPRRLFNTFLPPADTGANKAVARQTPTAQVTKQPAKVAKQVEQTKVTVKKVKKVEKFSSGLTVKALNIIATEIGVEPSELADAIQFSDLGVDSLMSLTISGRFREELDLEVQSTLFTDFPTIGDVKTFLSQNETGAISELSTDDSDGEMTDGTEMTTPDPELDSRETLPTTYSSTEKGPLSEVGEDEVITIIRTTIADEMGIAIEEIADTTDLSTIGMDSLMSLTILGNLREKTSLTFDSTLLVDNHSIEEIRKTLGLDAKPTPEPGKELVKVTEKLIEVTTKFPPATSVLLQGNPRTATRKLFLFPDGSGSATSYVSIPPIAADRLCVYGLNCPFMKNPTSYTNGIDGVSKLYLDEVLRRQPEGPYLLGGWSAGGVVALEVTRQLQALAKANPGKNYKVEQLVLIDAPCPIRLEPLPSRLHHFFDKIGLLGTGNPSGTPEWLLPHFEYSIKNLTAYKPEILPISADAPKAFLIWARDGVCKNPEDPRPPPQKDDPKSMNWLLNNRTDFGFNGWDKLLGAENCTTVAIDGNHFTMMREPIAIELGNLIRKQLNL